MDGAMVGSETPAADGVQPGLMQQQLSQPNSQE
jgi:hypothetical protein